MWTWNNLLNSNLGKLTAIFNSTNDMLHKSQKIPLFPVPQFTYLQDNNNDSDITQQFENQKTQPKC